METDRNRWNIREATVSYKARARLTPTLTHVVTYELVTSGAEDDAMSAEVDHFLGARNSRALSRSPPARLSTFHALIAPAKLFGFVPSSMSLAFPSRIPPFFIVTIRELLHVPMTPIPIPA